MALGTWLSGLLALRTDTRTGAGIALGAALLAGAAGWWLAHGRWASPAGLWSPAGKWARVAGLWSPASEWARVAGFRWWGGQRTRGPDVNRPSGESPSWGWVAVTALLGIVCGASATAARVAVRDAEPLASLVERHANVRVELAVRDDPHTVGDSAGRPTYLVAATLTRVESGVPGQDGPAGARDTASRRGADTASKRGADTVVVMDARILVLASDADWRTLLPGQRVAASGRLMPARGGDLRAAVLSVSEPPHRLGQPGWGQRAAGALRDGLRLACAPLPDEPGGLLPGLVIGDVSQLPATVEEDFRTTGLSHLTAVSGANVAIVVGLVLFIAGWARASPQVAMVASAAALAGFVILARPSPSVLRAAAMGAIALLALGTGRPRAALPALGTTVIVLIVVDPELAGHAGFALSVLATAGLLLIAPRWRDALRCRGVPPGLAEALAVPTAAQACCAPVLATLSGSISLVAVPANLVAAPAVAPATVLGVVAAAVSPLWPAAAGFLAWLAGWPAWWLVTVARVGADLPAGTLPWLPGPTGGILLAGIILGLLVACRRRLVRRLSAVVVLAVMIGVLPVRIVASGWPPPGWAVVVCAVGQGDLIVLAAGPGTAVVVDTGTDAPSADRCLRRLGIRQIPLLLVSHFHADHVGGVAGVFRGRPIGVVVTPQWPEPVSGRLLVERTAAAAGVPLRRVSAGWSYATAALRITALGPSGPMRGTRSDPNNNSLVLSAEVGPFTILLPGDAEGEQQRVLMAGAAQRRLLTAGPGAYLGAAGALAEGGRALVEGGGGPIGDGRAAPTPGPSRHAGGAAPIRVLKLPHHGSMYQDRDFLAMVNPAIVLVSVGVDNRFGHPDAAVLARLTRDGARVLRTDLEGDIAAVIADGRAAVVTRGAAAGGGSP